MRNLVTTYPSTKTGIVRTTFTCKINESHVSLSFAVSLFFSCHTRCIIVLYSYDIQGQTVINPVMTGTQVRFVELDWAKEEYKSSIGHQQRKARKVGKDSLWQAKTERRFGFSQNNTEPCYSCVILARCDFLAHTL